MRSSGSVPGLPTDPLADVLRDMHLPVADHHLDDRPGSMYIGPRVRLRDAEIVYRRPEPGLLLIVLYRRLGERRASLANPFADLFWFLRLCVEPRFGLSRVLCHVSTGPYRDRGGLDDARMVRLCRHLLGAEWIDYDRHPWLCQDVGRLRARLERLRQRFDSVAGALAHPSPERDRHPIRRSAAPHSTPPTAGAST
ncbi:hypothetical protein [Imhoffiella purpurea]|uniref:Uncharacterized protein n=1 Tax=Imhoffiella purpurea TaxID=1249627 RepID=W9VZ22_9GAMM|nr:hypothetical protein [Imhoffiella purpurea]EXJ15650.1 hypothetical protein D779_1157 [Imhoffiella purpurea]